MIVLRIKNGCVLTISILLPFPPGEVVPACRDEAARGGDALFLDRPGGAEERSSARSFAPAGAIENRSASHGFRPPAADSTRGYFPAPLRGVVRSRPFRVSEALCDRSGSASSGR